MFVYSLMSALDGGVFYVGRCSTRPEQRISSHLSPSSIANDLAHNPAKGVICQQHRDASLRPVLSVLQTCTTRRELIDAEAAWTVKLKAEGYPLVNINTGSIPCSESASRGGLKRRGQLAGRKNPNFGRKHSPDILLKQRLAQIGTQAGEKNPSAKLSAESIKAIRSLVASGLTRAEVARRYGVSDVLIGKIASRQIWRCIPEAEG